MAAEPRSGRDLGLACRGNHATIAPEVNEGTGSWALLSPAVGPSHPDTGLIKNSQNPWKLSSQGLVVAAPAVEDLGTA